jgi:hypothetical protein
MTKKERLSKEESLTINEFFSTLKDMIKAGHSKFEVEYINYGDRYYNENGESINFEIAGKNYRVGYSYITEDADDWAQAECYQVYWCDCDDKNIEPYKVLELINNWESIERDYHINKILN